MNRSMVRFLLAKLLLIEAGLLLVPVGIALYYQESSQVFTALFSTIGILVVLGLLGIIKKPKKQRIYAKEQYQQELKVIQLQSRVVLQEESVPYFYS